ncbi:MAG: hypothetical protein WCP52_13890 [Bacteroidota bacterium]
MNKNQISKNNMYDKMKVFFVNPDFSPIWSPFAKLDDKITLFGTKKDSLDKYIIQQQLTTTGITQDKSAELKKAEKLTVKLARKARVWAKSVSNDTLATLFDITKSTLSRLVETESIAKMTEIHTALNANATPLADYNITVLNISDLFAAIKAAKLLLSTPGTAKATTKAGTQAITEYMKEIDDILKDIDDLLIPEYEDTEPDMVKEYRNNRKIDNIGHYLTQLIAHITPLGATTPIQNVIMTIIELNRSNPSDINGIALIEKFRAGTYHIKFTALGYQTHIIIIKTIRGKKVEITVELTPNP